jgi:hypothetical protein
LFFKTRKNDIFIKKKLKYKEISVKCNNFDENKNEKKEKIQKKIKKE